MFLRCPDLVLKITIDLFKKEILFLELGDKAAWTQHGYSKKFESFWNVADNVDRIEESKVSAEEFIEKYEKPYKPVIIQGVQNSWKAQYKWTIEVHN